MKHSQRLSCRIAFCLLLMASPVRSDEAEQPAGGAELESLKLSEIFPLEQLAEADVVEFDGEQKVESSFLIVEAELSSTFKLMELQIDIAYPGYPGPRPISIVFRKAGSGLEVELNKRKRLVKSLPKTVQVCYFRGLLCVAADNDILLTRVSLREVSYVKSLTASIQDHRSFQLRAKPSEFSDTNTEDLARLSSSTANASTHPTKAVQEAQTAIETIQESGVQSYFLPRNYLKLGIALRTLQQRQEAKQALQQGVAAAESSLTRAHLVKMQCERFLAAMLRSEAKYEAACQIFEDQALLLKRLRVEPKEMPRVDYDLALSYWHLGRRDRAKRYATLARDRLLDIVEADKNFADSYVMSQLLIASFAYAEGDLAGAESGLRETLDSIEELKQDVSVLTVSQVVGTYGALLQLKGDIEESRSLLRRAVRLMKVGESYRREAAAHLLNLGHSLCKAGEYGAAVQYVKDGIRTLEEGDGGPSETLFRAWINLAVIYSFQMKKSKLVDCIEAAEKIYKTNNWGPEHPAASRFHTLRGMLFENESKFEKALEEYQLAAAKSRSYDDDIHAADFGCIARMNIELGRLDGALEASQESLDLFRKIYVESHPSVISAYEQKIVVHLCRGEFDTANEGGVTVKCCVWKKLVRR